MNLKTLTLPYDVYSRHKLVASFLKNPKVVLDVGGSLTQLKQFLPSKTQVLSADIVGGDVIYSGSTLPFKSKSVDATVSIDTIEHISSEKRQLFVDELVRVAKHQVIIAAPYGTKAHLKAEKDELSRQKSTGELVDTYLKEHVKHGLPDLSQIKHWISSYSNHQLMFSGSFRSAQNLFRLHRSEIKIPKLDRIWFEAKKPIFAIINLVLFPIEKQVSLNPNVNRFYLSIDL